MLREFTFSNFRSFRDETTLSMEAVGYKDLAHRLIPYKSKTSLLPAAAIFGKNGGGKSNVIRAFWLAAQFILNAQRTQHETAPVPVTPFLLDDRSAQNPTRFEFNYVLDGVDYHYSFEATMTEIISEKLHWSPNGQKALIFSRDRQSFKFTKHTARRQLISETVGKNQLYFSVACTMNDPDCIEAMRWFREHVVFASEFIDLPSQLIQNAADPDMLRAMSDYAKAADLGIVDMEFKFRQKEIDLQSMIPDNTPVELKEAVNVLVRALSQSSEPALMRSEIEARAFHKGIARDGSEKMFALPLYDESDGTHKLMALAPAIERVLACGGVLLVDELEETMHPLMVEFLISKFQSPKSNPNHAQIIFTTHNTELLTMEYLRKDQLYFVDKDCDNGVSELYSISELSTPTNTNIRKNYLLGKYGGIPTLPTEEV